MYDSAHDDRTFKTGETREQTSLLPARIEDYVAADNPVWAIERFVGALDVARLGFRHADPGAEEAGQPPYDPADLLKLCLYGYMNQIRSSRRLERESRPQSGFDLVAQEPEARLSNDRQLPQGELEGR
jgi:transposase